MQPDAFQFGLQVQTPWRGHLCLHLYSPAIRTAPRGYDRTDSRTRVRGTVSSRLALRSSPVARPRCSPVLSSRSRLPRRDRIHSRCFSFYFHLPSNTQGAVFQENQSMKTDSTVRMAAPQSRQRPVYPPSTIRWVAVMKLASSEARNKAALATSLGSPSRFNMCSGAT